MPIGSMTYQNIVDTVKTWIKSNCSNITKFSEIPNVFKSGYTTTVQYAGDATSPSKYTTKISGNAVSQVATTTVDTDMTNFLTSIGVTNTSKTIPASEFMDFVENMVSFCSTKLAYSISQYSTNKYLIYTTANTSYSSIRQINEDGAFKIITTEDINDILNSIINVTKQTIKNKPVTYTITMHT